MFCLRIRHNATETRTLKITKVISFAVSTEQKRQHPKSILYRQTRLRSQINAPEPFTRHRCR